jgi:hypothetical protein
VTNLTLTSHLIANGFVQTLGQLLANQSLDISGAGSGVKVAEGANAEQGTATLVAGTVTVANTSVTANSRIMLTNQALAGVGVPFALGVTARVPGTSFTITSSSPLDTSLIAYEIFEPG